MLIRENPPLMRSSSIALGSCTGGIVSSGVLSGCVMRPSVVPACVHLVALVDDAQAFECEQVIDLANVFGTAAHQRGQSTRGYHGHIATEFLHQPSQDAVDQPQIAVVKPRLH